jgi:hypothetical protein
VSGLSLTSYWIRLETKIERRKAKQAAEQDAGSSSVQCIDTPAATQALISSSSSSQSQPSIQPGIPVSFIDVAARVLQQHTVTHNGGFDDNASTSLFPTFLLPGAFELHMTQVQSGVAAADAAPTPFTPMMPHPIARRLLQNAYEEMRLGLPFLGDLTEMLALLDTQYSIFGTVPPAIPSSSYAHTFALVNAVVALAVRHKMAAGAETHIAGIAAAYYRNATLVTHHLILQTPTRQSVQALRAMAAFAGGTPDPPAQAILLANAEQQERMLGMGVGDE